MDLTHSGVLSSSPAGGTEGSVSIVALPFGVAQCPSTLALTARPISDRLALLQGDIVYMYNTSNEGKTVMYNARLFWMLNFYFFFVDNVSM